MDAPSSPTSSRIQPLRGRETAVAWVALAILGLIAFGPFAKDGGFTLDDWSNGSGALQSGGFGGGVSYFADITAYRPVLVVYVPAIYQVFGTHMGLHIAWAGVIAIAGSGVLFAILRVAGLRLVHAWPIAALVLVFPWFDSTRFWITASQVSLGVTLALGGVLIALIGLRRSSWKLHIAALAFYAASVLTYEIALPLIAAAGLLYVGLAGWSAAWRRWAADLVLVVAGVVWVGSQTTRGSGGLSDHLEHLRDIVTQGGVLLGRSVFPAGPQRTGLALGLLGAIALIGLAVWRFDARRRTGVTTESGTSVVPWLFLGVAGLVVAAAGWAMFIPADPYYTPSVYGFTNRVNGLAGFGLVLTVYAACGIVGALAGRVGDHPRRVATAVTLVLAVALGVGYKGALERHSDLWVEAYDAEMAGLGQIKSKLPTLPDGTTVFVSGHPQYQTLGVPIFSTTWDLDGIVKLQYKNASLSALPVFPGTTLECSRSGVTLTGSDGTFVPYGKARLIDIPSGRTAAPTNARQCRREAPTFVAGPAYLGTEY